MKTEAFQAISDAWTSQFADPAVWQTWLQNMQANGNAGNQGVKVEPPLKLDPALVGKLQKEYFEEFAALWRDMLTAKTPQIVDRRFSGAAWKTDTMAAFSAATYLLNARFLNALACAIEAPPKLKQRIRFSIQQTVDAMSPANFLVTNPEARQRLVETQGGSLLKGISKMLADIGKGRISHTDEAAFEVGRNVASTEGAVVFENELFQLIQYKPLTRTVYQRPLLIVPPCINKYYILDLQPENSLVRYAVEQGHTVLLMSWRNPDMSLAHLTWDDYIGSGPVKAISVVQQLSGQKKINALGFCVGGTLLSTALAVLQARGENPVSSLTLLTTLLDFSDTGMIDVYVDETHVRMREQAIGRGGLMRARDLAAAFNSLRPNDLVWNYVGSSYLKGEDPPPFDLLYWNGDGTNLPGPMFCWYLRHLYLENSLKAPGKLKVLGEPVDLGSISAPAFIYGSREDHIVPWVTAYASATLINRKKPANNRFILGASGHIAGVINPPAGGKRGYWSNKRVAPHAADWLAGAEEHQGSWWPEWAAFLARHAGKQAAAPRRYGSAQFPPIEPAPGRYVKVKAD